MTKHIQHLGGDTAQNDAYTGLVRELTVDTTKNTVRVHDGATAGGTELARSSDVVTSHTALLDRGLVDQHPITAITGLQPALDSKASVTHVHTMGSLIDVTLTSLAAGDSLLYNGTAWVNYGDAGGGTGGGTTKRIWSDNVAASLGTTQINPGTAAPLVTAGTELWTVTLTPLSAASTFMIQTTISAAASNNNANLTLALFRGSTYIGATVQIANSGNNSTALGISITDRPNTTAPVTYSVRIGTSTGTWYANRRTNEITYGGLNNGWTILEY